MTDQRTSTEVATQLRSPLSRTLSILDRLVSRPLVAAVVLSGDALWVGYSITVGFPARLEIIFQTLVAALTLAMVFVIQHTQARQQAATQRKLDEILYALPDADNAVVSLEHASDTELRATGESHHAIRRSALTVGPPPSADDVDR